MSRTRPHIDTNQFGIDRPLYRTANTCLYFLTWLAVATSATLLSDLLLPHEAKAAPDEADIAVSAAKFGGSVGKLLLISVEHQHTMSPEESNRYTQLADRVKQQLETGRATSALVQANWDVIGTTLAVAAAKDPEKYSKAVTAVFAWGAFKTGQMLGDTVLKESKEQAKKIIVQGLQNAKYTKQELQQMTPTELRDRVGDFQVGGKKIREILADEPEVYQQIQAQTVDLAVEMGVEALALAKGTEADVQQIKADLAATNKHLKDFENAVSTQLNEVETRLTKVEQATRDVSVKFKALDEEVKGNTKAIQSLAQISYSGWSTSQKIQAVESGLVPDLTKSQRDALVENLQAEQRRETLVSDLNSAAQNFGNLATIAKGIGLPEDTVKALSTAQIGATAIAQFATGNYLGAIAGLMGAGAPDPAAERHAEMMKYLGKQFEQINKTLNRIVELQVKTLEAIAELSRQQQQFRQEVLSQLDRMEDTVLRSERILKALLINNWTECHSLVNNPVLNGEYDIQDRATLIDLISSPLTKYYAARCYTTMAGFLDAWVRPALWAGQVIAADTFPQNYVEEEPDKQKLWDQYKRQQVRAFISARNFILDDKKDASDIPAWYLARIGQPVVNVYYADKLDEALSRADIRKQLVEFNCDQKNILNTGLHDLVCFQTIKGTSSRPRLNRWNSLMSAPLIGPHSRIILDTALVVSTLSDFSEWQSESHFDFVNPDTIENFSTNGPDDKLDRALAEKKGAQLLRKAQWLSEATVFQQSLIYGDYTARSIEAVLYDSQKKAPITVPTTNAQKLAIDAIRWNPILARNVVMLLMRHSVEDGFGGRNGAVDREYSQTYYNRALQDFTGLLACTGSPVPEIKLKKMFPEWKFEYRVSTTEQQANARLQKCPARIEPDGSSLTPLPEFGSGVAVSFGDFYVTVPSPTTLTEGVFEQTETLRFSLRWRDRLSQAIQDRNFYSTISATANADPAAISSLTFSLMNYGWDWRQSSKIPNH